jgi:hypothetical protein
MSAAALRWTAEDEAMLDAEGLGDALGAAGGFELSDEEDDDGGGAPSEEQVARDARSAAKTALLQNSVLSDIEGYRRPRWRLVAELLPGETADDIPKEAVMRGASLFRAGVRAVLGGIVLRRAALAKRRAALKADRTDLLDLFGFFAVPLRAWLAKAVKLPVMSILSEPAMNLDVRAASSGSGGLAGPLMRCAVGLRLVKTDTLEQRMLKLKVRVKGVLDELEKQSVRHKTLPGNVVDFLHKLSCDGAYLPPAFLFEAERSELEFSELGATRHMGAAPLRPLLLAGVEEELLAKQRKRKQRLRVGDRVMCNYKGSAAELGATVQAVHGGGAHFDVEYHHSCEVERRLEASRVRAVAFGRRHLLLLNLLVVRALLRMVIEPWNFGMGRRPKRPRVRQNLRVLASVLLAIVRLAMPGLPPGCEPPPGWKSKLEAVDEAPAEDEEEDEEGGEGGEGGDARAEKGDGEDTAGGDGASADGSQNGDGGASSTGKEGEGGSGGGKDGETSTAADDDDGNADGAAAAAPTAPPLPSLFSATEREIACELLPQTHFDEARHLLGWLPDMKDRLLRWLGTVTGAVEDTDRQQREREAEEQRGSEKGDHANPVDVAKAAAAKAGAVAKATAAKAGASVGAAAGLLTGAAAAVVGLASS